MIYQCYHRPEQLGVCFTHAPYRPFGVSIETNPLLYHNCDELRDHRAQKQLCEYAAMLWHFRNHATDTDDWIGFTSYRQPEKSSVVFYSADEIAPLARAGVVSWREHSLHTDRMQPVSVDEFSEACHPGIGAAIRRLLAHHGRTLPEAYTFINVAPFCNYWAMSRALFGAWMEWGWPLIQTGLETQESDPFLKNWQMRPLAYVAERLFIVWLMQELHPVRYLGGCSAAWIRSPEDADLTPV